MYFITNRPSKKCGWGRNGWELLNLQQRDWSDRPSNLYKQLLNEHTTYRNTKIAKRKRYKDNRKKEKDYSTQDSQVVTNLTTN